MACKSVYIMVKMVFYVAVVYSTKEGSVAGRPCSDTLKWSNSPSGGVVLCVPKLLI